MNCDNPSILPLDKDTTPTSTSLGENGYLQSEE